MTTPIPPSPPVERSLLQKAIDAGPNMEPWDLRLSHQRLGHAELVLPNRGWFLEISDGTIKDDEQQAQFVRDVAFIAAASPTNISEILSAHEAEVGRLREALSDCEQHFRAKEREGIHELFTHEDAETIPGLEGDKPLCRFVNFVDGGDPSVGEGGRQYWALAPDQSGTELADLLARAS